MHGEVVAIGDELTSGVRLDTNSQWLSGRLGELGVRVLYHATVGDELEAVARVLREALERSDLVICTGGLGPTEDDLTREGIAAAIGCPLELDEQALTHIKNLFARRRREMPERNLKQALLPRGGRIVHNPHGSAPGIDVTVERRGRGPARLFSLPGVPAEMKEMWEQTVRPELATWLGGKPRVIRHRLVKCFGVGESDLEQMLPNLIRRGRQPSVGITVSRATITLRVTAEGDDEAMCYESMEPTLAVIRENLGEIVFGQEDDELQHVVVRMLRDRGDTLAVAEAGTGGMLCDWLSSADDSEQVFVGGSVLRDAQSACAAWGLADWFSAGDEQEDRAVCAAWATACRERFQADYGLVVGAFPEHDESTSPGHVTCGFAGPQTVRTKQLRHAGHPDILKARTAKSALNLLRLYLESAK